MGGGLAGLSAAHTILERGGRVLVLDKSAFLGGNSVKATSGITWDVRGAALGNAWIDPIHQRGAAFLFSPGSAATFFFRK